MLLCCHTYVGKLKNTSEWHNKLRIVAVYGERGEGHSWGLQQGLFFIKDRFIAIVAKF